MNYQLIRLATLTEMRPLATQLVSRLCSNGQSTRFCGGSLNSSGLRLLIEQFAEIGSDFSDLLGYLKDVGQLIGFTRFQIGAKHDARMHGAAVSNEVFAARTADAGESIETSDLRKVIAFSYPPAMLKRFNWQGVTYFRHDGERFVIAHSARVLSGPDPIGRHPKPRKRDFVFVQLYRLFLGRMVRTLDRLGCNTRLVDFPFHFEAFARYPVSLNSGSMLLERQNGSGNAHYPRASSREPIGSMLARCNGGQQRLKVAHVAGADYAAADDADEGSREGVSVVVLHGRHVLRWNAGFYPSWTIA